MLVSQRDALWQILTNHERYITLVDGIGNDEDKKLLSLTPCLIIGPPITKEINE